MLYISREASKATPSTPLFKSRGLDMLTSCKISDVNFFVKPKEQQLAFDGYKTAMEAFIHATIVHKKVSTDQEAYPIPKAYKPTVPIPLPPIVIRFQDQKTPVNNVERFEKYVAQFGMQKTPMGKDTLVYTIDRPSFTLIEDGLPKICSPQSAFLEGRCQLVAATSALLLYRCIDGFLATHTYEYKGPNPNSNPDPTLHDHFNNQELRVGGHWFRPGMSAKSVASKSRKLEEGETAKRIDDQEEIDLTPHVKGHVSMEAAVRVAKPSPHVSKINWGGPHEVPNKPGIMFPYFHGMFTPDSAGFRTLCSSLFFRNFATETMTAREAYRHFRQNIGTFVNSSSGGIMTHILSGIQAAIDGQALLYLVFDGEVYLGFCLLGEYFDVHLNGKWFAPLTADQLHDELQGMLTHDKAMEKIIAKLERMTDLDGKALESVKETVTGAVGLAKMLGKLKLDEDEDDEKELSQLLARLRFPPFLTPSIANVTKGVNLLLGNAPLTNDMVTYIPNKSWTHFREDVGIILAMFGPRSISFRNVKGEEFKVPSKAVDKDPYEEKVTKMDKVVDRMPRVLVGEKPLPACISEWKDFVRTGSMKMDFTERAAGSRNVAFDKKVFAPVWDILKAAAVAQKIGIGKEKKGNAVAGTEDFGKGNHDDFFAAMGDDDLDAMFA